MRTWAPHLTLQQLGIVLFIFDRTAAWGKEWEMIRYKSFATGIFSKDGTKCHAGSICNSARTAARLTDELVSMGMLLKRRTRTGNIWALNYEWLENDMNKLRKMKRDMPRMADQDMPNMESQDMPNMAGSILNVENINIENINNSLPCSAGREAGSSLKLTEAMERALEKGKAARERRELRKNGRMSSLDIGREWTKNMLDAPWAEVLDLQGRRYLVKRDAQALKSYSDRFLKSHPAESFREYLRWLIHHWPGLLTEVFGWMTVSPPPQTPAALFIIKWADRLEEKFLQRRAFEKRLAMTPEERETHRLVRSGMSPDAARRKAVRVSEPAPAQTAAVRSKIKPFRAGKPDMKRITLPHLPDINQLDTGTFGDYEND